MTDCVFCKIAAGEIPASVVYEDDKVIAFDDLELNARACAHHPKQHFANMATVLPNDLMGHLFNTVKKVAEIKGIDKTGYRSSSTPATTPSNRFITSMCTFWAAPHDELWIACSLKIVPLLGELRENSRHQCWFFFIEIPTHRH